MLRYSLTDGCGPWPTAAKQLKSVVSGLIRNVNQRHLSPLIRLNQVSLVESMSALLAARVGEIVIFGFKPFSCFFFFIYS